MSKPPAGSLRDTAALAKLYSDVSHWQRKRGLELIEIAAPRAGENVVDIGCGTGELSVELAGRVGPSGRVMGIDPDPARIEKAKANRPAGLDNLVFERGMAERFAMVEDATADLVYSNYTIHWVLDQPAMLDEVQRILRPGGRFVAEFLRELIALFLELHHLMPDSDDVEREVCCLSEDKWRAMIAARRFEAERFETPEFALEYESLQALFDWLEASSHGAFDAAKLSPETRRAYEKRFPGAITVPCKAYQMVLRRRGDG